jgi:cationic peptide transport system permease protein
MIRDAMELIYIAPWTVILPGAAIVGTIFTVTLISRSISRVLSKYRS